MRNGYFLFDSHAHVFGRVKGRNACGPTSSGTDGQILMGDRSIPFMKPEPGPTAYPAERLIHDMDACGVDRALMMQNPTIGTRNEELLEAAERYPERLYPIFQLDPRDPASPEKLRLLQKRAPVSALKVEISEFWGWCGIYPDYQLDEANTFRLFECAAKDKRPVILDIGIAGERGYQLENVEKAMDAFPGLCFIVDHIGNYMRKYDADERLSKRWRQALNLCRRENACMGLASICVHAESDARGGELLKEVAQTLGSEKLVWGTDLPTNFKLLSYEQMADFVIDAEFLNAEEKSGILGGNLSRILGCAR